MLQSRPTLLVVVFLAAAVLSLKCSADLLQHPRRLPPWFVPVFVSGIVALLGFGVAVVVQALRHGKPQWARGRAAASIWLLLCLSIVATSAVHGFYPFRPVPLKVLWEVEPILRLNMGMTALAFLGTAACAAVYGFGKPQLAITLLYGLGLLLLLPNDACNNAFNAWWLARVGASPLMFVPNLYAIVFGTCALMGVHTRLTGLALAVVGFSVGLLGLGHMLRVIW